MAALSKNGKKSNLSYYYENKLSYYQNNNNNKSCPNHNKSSYSANKSYSNNKQPFVYGFRVHSLSQVNSSIFSFNPSSTTKNNKNKKSLQSINNKNKQNQPKKSPFSTTTSTLSIDLYTSSTQRLLDNKHLNAANAISLHDLQCGTATVALQAFLSYKNLRRVFGIEQNKNLFLWATKNLMSLIKNGYQNNRYLLVEQIPYLKMVCHTHHHHLQSLRKCVIFLISTQTIAQKSSETELERKKFKIGEVVYAFIPLKQNNIKKRDNYTGTIRGIHEGGTHFDVEMSATKTVIKKVHKESIFKPGTERTFEIVRGDLFGRCDSFRADVIFLPYSISNDSFRSLLLTGCKRSPIGSRILSFSHLESWDGFPQFQLRRVDYNVYDNDRYNTNMSPHQKLYVYQHTLSHKQASSPKDIITYCRLNSEVTIRDPKLKHWFTAKVLGINDKTKSIMVRKNGFLEDTGIEEIKIEEQRIHLISRRFKEGDLICAYCPKMIDNEHDELYTLFRAQVMECNSDGTYGIQYEDGENLAKINECYIFKRTEYKYQEGQLCVALRYDKIPHFDEEGELINVKQIAKKLGTNQCIIRHRNPDGTYRVEFINVQQYQYHDNFCEYWLVPYDNNYDLKLQEQDGYETEPKLPLVMEIDYDQVAKWRPNVVAHWLKKCGIKPSVANVVERNNVNGVFLFELDGDLLMNDMKIPKYDANEILRYMQALKSKLEYNVDDEEIAQLSLEIQELDGDIKQLQQILEASKQKLNKVIKSHHDEYSKYREWQLKKQCIMYKGAKLSFKDIAQRLKKNQSWVKKTSKLKANALKKPSGNVIKQMESLQQQIQRCNKQLKHKQAQMLQARHKLQQFMDI